MCTYKSLLVRIRSTSSGDAVQDPEILKTAILYLRFHNNVHKCSCLNACFFLLFFSLLTVCGTDGDFLRATSLELNGQS